MIKMNRKHHKKHKNQGNSYIMVVATLSFLAVLVTALLVAIGVLYKLKAYDINSRDNFYYLEQAMDEIYAGIGTDSMTMLSDAYNDTIEVLVYYDTNSKSYVTMTDEEANSIFKSTYLQKISKYYIDDVGGTNLIPNITQYLNDFISNKYNASTNAEGVQLSVGNIVKQQIDGVEGIVFTDVTLRREAYYSTQIARASDSSDAASDKFIQTLTTDIVVTSPEFDVTFNTISAELNDLYSFSLISDLGVEITGATTKVDITGNLYAAADFYNKDYNITDEDNPNYLSKATTPAAPSGEGEDEDKDKSAQGGRYNVINEDSYDNEKYDGKRETSMYSGLYIGGSDVVLTADRIIVPGTIAAMNCADLTIAAATKTQADVWADGIVLGGYSLKASNTSDEVNGSTLTMRADAYISDDLELNATGCMYSLTGNYYGYNYASTDNRTYNGSVVTKDGRSYVNRVSDAIKDGTTIEGQNHYNSSAIIINGENASLDLKGVESMYIAGQAYVELSKETKTTEVKVTNVDGTNYVDQNANDKGEIPDQQIGKDDDTVDVKSYEYNSMVKNKDGNATDNYSVSTKDSEPSNILDYRTGEAISVKSNQLAYIPNWAVTETKDGELYLSIPEGYRNNDFWKTDDGKTIWDNLAKVPVIKSVISGKTYYFLDFSDANESMNEYIEKYAQLFSETTAGTTDGEVLGMQNITDYPYFKVKMLDVKDAVTDKGELQLQDNNISTIYSNSAISIKTGNTITIKANSSSLAPLTEAVKRINANIDEHNAGITTGSTQPDDGSGEPDDDKNATPESTIVTENASAATIANSVTSKLQQQYKEAKWLLSPSSRNPEGVAEAHDLSESDITPINHFFNYAYLTDEWIKKDLLCGYDIYVSDGDVKLSDKNIKGIVICRGDVTFTDDVENFEGLIVAGGKIYVTHSMSFIANEEIIKSILRECDERQIEYKSGVKFYELFRQYKSFYVDNTGDGDVTTKSLRDISSVQFEDIIGFRNWVKNVK